MEAVGFAASFITIVQLSKAITDHLLDMKNADKDIDFVYNEVLHASQTLIQFKYHYVDNCSNLDKNAGFRIADLLGGPRGPLAFYQGVLESLVKQLKIGKPRGAITVFFWPFRKKDIDELRALLDRYRLIFLTAMGLNVNYDAPNLAITFKQCSP